MAKKKFNNSFVEFFQQTTDEKVKGWVQGVLRQTEVSHFNRSFFRKVASRFSITHPTVLDVFRLYDKAVDCLSAYPVFGAMPWLAAYAMVEAHTQRFPFMGCGPKGAPFYVNFKACGSQILSKKPVSTDFYSHLKACEENGIVDLSKGVKTPLYLHGHIVSGARLLPMQSASSRIQVSFEVAKGLVHHKSAEDLIEAIAFRMPRLSLHRPATENKDTALSRYRAESSERARPRQLSLFECKA